MNHNLKNLLGGTDPNQAIIIPKSGSDTTAYDVHRSLVADGVIPLRGNYDKLPAIMSSMDTIRFMVPKSTKVAIVIEDNDLDLKQMEAIRQLVVDRSFSHWSLDSNARIIIISDAKPAMFQQVFKGNFTHPRRATRESALTA